ncbi:MAG: hypothetical protein PHH06_04010 [Candidatus Gracilibacteria bacterium]|nr:hypothetical protein [Candidatus Gracilibacteria bacterium]
MKRIYLLVFIILILSLGFNFYFLYENNSNKLITPENINFISSGSIDSIGITNYNLSTGSGIITEEKLSKVDLEKECKKVIEGQESEYLLTYRSDLLDMYNEGFEVLDDNEYINTLYMIKGDCDNLDGDIKEFCLSLKNKNPIGNKGDYEYQLSKSIIEGKNYCGDILNDLEKDDCNKTLLSFSYNDKSIIHNNILVYDNFIQGKILFDLGKDKYLDLLKSRFLISCIN